MTVKDLAKLLGGKTVSGSEERNVEGCYIGDLLSLAMSRVKSDEVWITIQTNINVTAVASLTDAGCVVICDGFSMDADALEKAKDEDISVIETPISAYEAAKLI